MSISSEISVGNEKTVEDYALYSSAIHTVIFTAFAVLVGLLQIIPTNTGVRIDTLRGFLVVFMIYFVLLVCEVKFRRNQALIYYCVGNFSHLFGVFAADMLVSLIFPIVALVIAILYLFWFFFVMYRSFAKNMPPKVDQSGTANPVDQLPPV